MNARKNIRCERIVFDTVRVREETCEDAVREKSWKDTVKAREES